MNEPIQPREPANDGATTAGQGTPTAVDVSPPRGSIATFAVFLAGPVIWSVHFMVVYLAVEAGCTGDGPGLAVFDPPVPAILTMVATVVAALATLGTAAWGYRRWRAQVDDGSLAFVGFLLSLLGTVSILLVGLPALVLPACAP